MHPLARIDAQISTSKTIMWVFRALAVVPLLFVLAGLNGAGAAVLILGAVFFVPFTAVHFGMWFRIESLKRQRLRFLPPPMPRPPYGPPPYGPPPGPPYWR